MTGQADNLAHSPVIRLKTAHSPIAHTPEVGKLTAPNTA